MAKQPDVCERCEPVDGLQGSKHKEDGNDAHSGSFHDQVDMQRLGKEQELKVRRSYCHPSRSRTISFARCILAMDVRADTGCISRDLYSWLTTIACVPFCIDTRTDMRYHGDLGSHIQHRHFLFDQRRQIRNSLVIHRNLDFNHSSICVSGGDGLYVSVELLRPPVIRILLTRLVSRRAPSSGGQYHWYVALNTFHWKCAHAEQGVRIRASKYAEDT